MNNNYQDFLSLGSSLQGGGEKVEEVRMGLLGFKREIKSLKDNIDERKKEIEMLVNERKAIRQDIQLGRTLLDVDQRLRELEERLMIFPSKTVEDRHEDKGLMIQAKVKIVPRANRWGDLNTTITETCSTISLH